MEGLDIQVGELANAFSPIENESDIIGDVHFDDDERIDLISVAVHEFGYSIGLPEIRDFR